MPATIRYKSTFPSTKKPVETSASIGSDGLVTASAVFIVSNVRAPDYPVNSSIDQTIFSGLSDVKLQGLFVETRSLEKRNGLIFLRLGVVGVTNPPIFEKKCEISPRSFNKTQDFLQANQESVTRTFSFDYLAETVFVSTVLVRETIVDVPIKNPTVFNRWNVSGTGRILNYNPSNGATEGSQSGEQIIFAYPQILSSESREERAGIVRITKSAQFVYQ